MINFNINIDNIHTQGLTAQQTIDWMEKVSGGKILTDEDKKEFLAHIRDTRFSGNSRRFRTTHGASNEENFNKLFLNRINNGEITVAEVAKFICEKENLKLKHIRIFKTRITSSISNLKQLLSQAEQDAIGNEILQLTVPPTPVLTSIIHDQNILRFKYVTSIEEKHLKRNITEKFGNTFYSPWTEILVRKVFNIDIIPSINRILIRSEAMTDKDFDSKIKPSVVSILNRLNISYYSPINLLSQIDALIGSNEIKADSITTTRFNQVGEPVKVTIKNETRGDVLVGDAFSKLDTPHKNLQHLPMEYAKIEWVNLKNITTYVDSKKGFLKIVSFRHDVNGALNGILQHIDAAFK